MLAGVVLAAALYHWLQARGRVTPWIFPDELRYAEAARAVADGGSPRVRGELELGGALHAYVMAPAWLIDETGRAWSAAKALAALAFALTAVPVHAMARRVAGPVAATLAAVATVLLPAGFYASTTLQEPVAIPLAALAALLTARLVERFRWATALALAAACAAGALARGQLVILVGAAALALLVGWAAGDRRDRRPLLAGAAALALAATATTLARGRAAADDLRRVLDDPATTAEVIAHSAASTSIAVALVPAIAFAVVATRLRDPAPPARALAATLAGFGAVFLAYVGVKSAALGFAPISLVEERNLVYLEPLAMVALAALVGRPPRRALVAAAVAVGALVVTFPLTRTVTSEILSENPGLSWAGRIADDPRSVDPGLVPLLVAGLLAGALGLAWGRARTPLLGAVAVAVAVSGALAYRGDHDFARYIAASAWPAPELTAIDRAATGREVVVLVGRGADPVPLWTAAFWNRSVTGFADFDPFGPRNIGLAGRRGTVSPDGILPAGGARLVLHGGTAAIGGSPVAAALPPALRLTAAPGVPRVTAVLEGKAADGWAGPALRLVRYLEGPAGAVVLDVDTANPIVTGPRRITALVAGVVTRRAVPPGVTARVALPVPPGSWGLELTLRPVVSPGPADPRLLSLRVGAVRVPGVDAPLG